MKRIGACLLIIVSALLILSGSSHAESPRTPQVTGPGLLETQFHPGETVQYTFAQKVNLTIRVNPRTPPEQAPPFIPRRYQVEGEIAATFDSTPPGQPLHGAIQFKGLAVKDWVSTAQVADLETCLRQLESAHLTLSTALNGNLELSEVPARLVHDRFMVDVEDLRSIAQAVFISRISSQPLARGQQRESADFPIPGMIRPGIKMTILTEYLDDIPIAQRSNAEVRLSMNVPYQSHAVSPESSAAKMLERLDAAGVWTYLLDLDAHQVNFLHKSVRTETSYSVENTDNNESVRIPQSIFTVNKEFEVTARRVALNASPQRETDLAAFEKSLHESALAVPTRAEAAPTPSAGGEVSLGDLARRLRSERAAEGPKPAVQTNEPATSASVVAPDKVPAGFKAAAFPSGAMTAYIPIGAAEVDRTNKFIGMRLALGNPTPLVVLSMLEIALSPDAAAGDALDQMVSGLQASPGVQVLGVEKKTINGMPGVVIAAVQGGQKPSRILQSSVISEGKAFVTSCGSLPDDFSHVESLCRTVVESTKGK